MPKFLFRITHWTVGISFLLCASWVNLNPAAPTDHLNVLTRQSPQQMHEAKPSDGMPEKAIRQILSDRLDFFPHAEIPRLSRHLYSLCRLYKFDPVFVLAVIQVESEFRVKAASNRGALGLMQIQLPTARHVIKAAGVVASGYENDMADTIEKRILTEQALFDPFINISIGIAYLAWLRDHYSVSSPYYLLAAYNMGPSRLNQFFTDKIYYPDAANRYFKAILREIPDLRFYRDAKSDMKL